MDLCSRLPMCGRKRCNLDLFGTSFSARCFTLVRELWGPLEQTEVGVEVGGVTVLNTKGGERREREDAPSTRATIKYTVRLAGGMLGVLRYM